MSATGAYSTRTRLFCGSEKVSFPEELMSQVRSEDMGEPVKKKKKREKEFQECDS